MNWSKEWQSNAEQLHRTMKDVEKYPLTIGVDKGSFDGDKTVVSIINGKEINIIGENVELSIPIKDQWPRKVRAIQTSDLAVHEALPGTEYEWQITHVPTLTRFDGAIPDGDWTQDQLLKWCYQVQQKYPLAWEVLALYNNLNYQYIPIEALKQIQDYCLSVNPGDI